MPSRPQRPPVTSPLGQRLQAGHLKIPPVCVCVCYSTPKYHLTLNIKMQLLRTFFPPSAIWASLEAARLCHPQDNGIPTLPLYVLMFVIMEFAVTPQLHL